MKLNQQFFHDFFYRDPNDAKRYKKAKSETHYSGKHFFSYSTEIGCIYTTLDGEKVLFISEYGFSNTTRAHLSALRQASPLPLIYVPFDWDDNFTSLTGGDADYATAEMVNTLEDRFVDYFAGVDAAFIRYAARRREFIAKFENFRKFLDAVAPWKTPAPELENLYNIARELDDARAGQRAAILERQKTRELERLKRYADLPLTTVIGTAYADAAADKTEKRDAISYLKAIYPGHSFVWIDGEYCRTSQGVRVPRATAAKLYKLYAAGRVKIGMHLDCYTILTLNEDFVQIGCHKIPVANIKAISANL